MLNILKLYDGPDTWKALLIEKIMSFSSSVILLVGFPPSFIIFLLLESLLVGYSISWVSVVVFYLWFCGVFWLSFLKYFVNFIFCLLH